MKSCIKSADNDWLISDSIVINQFGKSLTQVLFAPEEVRCYHLSYNDSTKSDKILMEEGYVRDTLLAVLDEKQIGALQYILLSNSKSYSIDSIKVESPCLPIIEFEFTVEKMDTANVVLSLSDNSWSIFYDGKQQFNYNYADHEIMERYCRTFLNLYNPKMKK